VNHVAGHIPTMGEVIHTPKFHILVLQGAPTHVTTISLELADHPAPSAENTKDKE
ncbi:MAG: hypothetical protein GX117_04755, partial [Candidatus Hydrogenedentes bacterium]|nr:hypothetical protein [Candidatus Hydrogenedentota bacterium]